MNKGTILDWYLVEGKWHHCGMVNDGEKLSYYTDGVLTHTKDLDGTNLKKVE